MANYWKKKLDELNQSNGNSTSKSTTKEATSATKSDYWKNKLTELEKAEDIAPVKTTTAEFSNYFGTDRKAAREYAKANKGSDAHYMASNGDIVRLYTDTKKSPLESRFGVTIGDGLAFEVVRENEDSAEDNRKWFQAPAFDDGYDFGDVTKTILGTAGDATLGVGKGFLGAAEGIADLIGYGVAGAADWLGFDGYAADVRERTEKNLYGDFIDNVRDDIGVNDYSVLGDKADMIPEAIGQIGLMWATAGVGAAAGLGSVGTAAVSTGTMFTSSMGNGMSEAYQNGATDNEAFSYGLTVGVIDAISERLFAGLGKSVGNVMGKPISSLDDQVAKKIGDSITKKFGTGKSAHAFKTLAEGATKSMFEGGEELVAGIGSAFAKKLTYMSDEEVGELLEDESLLEQFIVSTLASGIMQGGDVKTAIKTDTDLVTGLNYDEQAVVDKVIEKRIAEAEKKGDLTAKDKTKIRDEVMEDLADGGISIDDIEATLGGDAYTQWKDSADKHDALQSEYDAIKNEYDELYNMKSGDKSDAQADHQAELKKRLEEMKAQLGDTTERDTLRKHLNDQVFGKVSNSRLVEAYNESGRRKQPFSVDLSQYDGKTKEILQGIMDKGIVNNSNKAHKFWEYAAKVAADKGFDITATTTEEIIAMETEKRGAEWVEQHLKGKTPNAYKMPDGSIAINVKSLEGRRFLLGHEITHTMEGAGNYGTLKDLLFAYEKNKTSDEAFEARLKEIAEKYDGINEDAEGELLADLVGEYLYSDSQFIEHLSAQNRNLFQKIWDEIKYLYNMATAGSQEARDLERIKREFEKAYRAETKNTAKDGGVKYHIGVDANGNKFVDVTEDIFDANDGESVARTIQKVIAKKFNNRIKANGQTFQINKTTNDEFRRSESATELLESAPQVYNDKLKTIANADEILATAKNWIGEKTKHNRKDDIVEFGRGNVMYRVNGNGYIADVLVGIRKNGSAVLYDLVNIYETKIAEGPVTVASNNNSQRRQGTSAGDIIAENSEKSSENSDIRYSLTEYTADEKKAHNDAAIDYFGKTYSWNETGYLLLNGTRLDFSGKHEGASGGYRTVDHRDISNALGDDYGGDSYSGALVQFMSEGNIRIIPEMGGINLSVMPTEAQEKALAGYIQLHRGEVVLDIDDANGYTVASVEYPIGTRSGKVLGDIRAYFEDGTKPEMSNAYSLTKEGEHHRYARGDGAMSELAYAPVKETVQDIAPVKETAADAPIVEEATPTQVYDRNTPIQTVEERTAAKLQNTEAELAKNNQLRQDSWVSFDEEIASLQAEYESKKNKDTKVANTILRRIERLRTMQSNVDADYAKRISDLAERVNKMNSPVYKRAEQRKSKQEEYTTEMENLVGDTSTWVDKKLGLSYKTNTLRRNLRDVVRDANGNRDIQKADAIYDELQGKYAHNEAALNKEATRIKQPYAEMKITKAEDAYIQMLGELRHNPDTTLTEEAVTDYYNKHKNNIDKAKVDKAIADARETYDSLLIRVNEVLKEQGMKEIPYRQGYFPHFTDPKQGFLAKLFNWKTKDFEIPTDIAGLTEQFNPNRSWQSFNKERKSDTTDYSFTKGMDTYVQGALDWIYHIEDIQKRRAFENHIRYIHSDEGIKERINNIRKNEEYDADEMQEQIDLVYKEAGNPLNNFVTDLRAGTNTLAGKKSSLDRGMEEMVNRKAYSTMTNISNRVTGNMVVGSVSSALTNFIPITQSWAEVSPVKSLRAMGDTIISTFRDDGTIAKSDFLTNRLRKAENLYQTGWDKAAKGATFLMEGIDSFTSQVVWRSKYLDNISNGMSESAAIKNADQFAKNVIGDRSRGDMPTIFDSKNPLIKTLTAFQLEVNNQYGYMFKDVPQDMKDKSVAKLVTGYAAMFFGAFAYNALYSSLTGRDAAFDPIGILKDLLAGIFGDDEEKEPTEIAVDFAEDVIQEIPFVGGLFGGGRVPISAAMPYDGVWDMITGTAQDVADKDYANLTKEWLNPVYYLAMPMGGGQIKKTVEGLSMFSDEHPVSGSYTTSGNLRYPVEDTFGNKLQAALFGQYSSKNAREYFDNEYAPLKEKQIEEYAELDLPIKEYREYREGLADCDTVTEKLDYINDLDLPIDKKSVMAYNVATQYKDVDGARDAIEEYGGFQMGENYTSVGGEQYRWYEPSEDSDAEAGWRKLTDEQVAKQDKVTSGLDITPEEYWGNKEEYDYAYDHPEKYAVAKSVGGYESYRGYSSDLYDIKADKDSSGKSISGSRKDKVIDYVNGLDIDYGMRLILFKSEYTADDTYNADIVDYLNSRDDISYDEMVTILKELDFTVDSNGNIDW